MDASPVVTIVVGLVALWAIAVAALWLLRPRDVPWREVLRVVPDGVRLIRGLIGDRATPLDVRVVLVGLLAWIVSPIDLIPEFVPVLGPLDDAIVAVLALRYVRRRIGDVELRTRWPGSPEGLALLMTVLGSR